MCRMGTRGCHAGLFYVQLEFLVYLPRKTHKLLPCFFFLFIVTSPSFLFLCNKLPHLFHYPVSTIPLPFLYLFILHSLFSSALLPVSFFFFFLSRRAWFTMETSSPSHKPIEEKYAALTLDEEEDTGLVLEDDEIAEYEENNRFILVGKLLTEKPVKFNFMKETLAAAWRPGKGMTVKEATENIYIFQFFHEVDMNRILEDGPWAYEQSLLVLKKLQPYQSPNEIPFTTVEFWVQVHNLPVGYSSERTMKAIGDYVGEFVYVDKNSFDGSWKAFHRIRVLIDVAKPLKRKMKIKKAGGSWSWIEFKYERLPTFCFICGVLGHADKFCPKLFEGIDKEAEKPYGPWLRAQGRRAQMTMGQRWLLSEPPRRSQIDKKGSQTEDMPESEDRGHTKAVNDKDQPGKESRQSTCILSSEQMEIMRQTVGKGKEKETVDERMDLGLDDIIGPSPTDGLIIIDQKRRRTESSLLEADSSSNEDIMLCESDGSKNFQGAGPVAQARPEK